jgi:release factor glutamine methyltransferase
MADQTATLFYVYADCLLRVASDALLPRSGGLLLARHLPLRESDRLLDLGCGAGLIAILAARRGHRVVATDLVPACCECARTNALLNGVGDRVEVRTGDLFAPVTGESFDVIAANPPQMPTPSDRDFTDDESRMHNAGPDGWELLTRIIGEAPRFLAPRGRLVLSLFGFLGLERALRELRAAGLTPTILAREVQPFPRLGRERLPHLRRRDTGGSLPAGLPAACSRLVLCGEKD